VHVAGESQLSVPQQFGKAADWWVSIPLVGAVTIGSPGTTDVSLACFLGGAPAGASAYAAGVLTATRVGAVHRQ
jgi:hypothetical protein